MLQTAKNEPRKMWEFKFTDRTDVYTAVVEAPLEAVAKSRAYIQVGQQHNKSVHDVRKMTCSLFRTSSFTPDKLPTMSLSATKKLGFTAAKEMVETTLTEELPYYRPQRVLMYNKNGEDHELSLVEAMDVASVTHFGYVLVGNVNNACRPLEMPDG